MKMLQEEIIGLFKDSVTDDTDHHGQGRNINLTINGDHNRFINVHLPSPDSREGREWLGAIQQLLKG